MEKINVEICIGTTCFIMGGSQLQNLEEYLSDDLKKVVTVSGCTCLDMCKNDDYGNAPFVKINEKIISNASVGSIIDYLLNLQKEG